MEKSKSLEWRGRQNRTQEKQTTQQIGCAGVKLHLSGWASVYTFNVYYRGKGSGKRNMLPYKRDLIFHSFYMRIGEDSMQRKIFSYRRNLESSRWSLEKISYMGHVIRKSVGLPLTFCSSDDKNSHKNEDTPSRPM